MRLRSFRLRIALLSATLAGGALIGFGIISWKLIYDAKISGLDTSLEMELKRASRPRQGDLGQPPRNLSIAGETEIALLIVGPEGNRLYQSPNWTPDLDRVRLLPRPPSPVGQSSDLPPNPGPGALEDPNPPPLGAPERPPAGFPLVEFPARYRTLATWRVGTMSSPTLQVAIAVSLQSLNQEMGLIRNIFLVSIPITWILIAAGAWLLSGSSLRPIRTLTLAIQKVSAKGLDQRLDSRAVDLEMSDLIQVFNQMLERLERSFKQASRFSGDAAHELKTPLTILQGELEQALQQAENGSDLQQRLGGLLDEVRRLSGIVRKLLLLSLADAGQISLYQGRIDLSLLLFEMVDDLELLAPDLTVQTNIAERLQVWGDRDLLIQVLQNLFSNAIKYNLPQGWINITADQQGSTLLVSIRNASQEILEGDRSLIFERFYRGDPARTRKVEGTGLGLSLAREIVRAHGGNLTLELAKPDQTGFTLSLPAARPVEL